MRSLDRRSMNIGIIGAGFTGLSAAYRLLKEGHSVSVFEIDQKPGGLAIGYKEPGWDWTLEKHYHHWFTNDDAVLSLAQEINHDVLTRTPYTNWYVDGKIYEFVSLKAALSFPLLTPVERVRQLAALGLLRFDPFWRQLEKHKTNEVMPRLMGERAYDMLWKSILVNKFGSYADEISLAWFWARIKKRTQALAYPAGGFLDFAEHLSSELEKLGGSVSYETEVIEISKRKELVISFRKKGDKKVQEKFDRVIVTLPAFAFLRLAPTLPRSYTKKLSALRGIAATNLVLRLSKPFFKDKTYWLSVADTKSPVMAIVEHTNFMDKKHYNNEHLVYLGNYMEQSGPLFKMDAAARLKIFDPFLKKINPKYRDSLIGYKLFHAPFAQPIISTNYSQVIPPFETPMPGVFLSNMQQVYPWDRGTNYAVELGEKVALRISNT